MGKNGNGEGTIKERRDGRWEARYHDANSNRRSVYGKTRKDVAEKLAAKIANKDSEPVQTVEQNDITARDFFAEYLAAMKCCVQSLLGQFLQRLTRFNDHGVRHTYKHRADRVLSNPFV